MAEHAMYHSLGQGEPLNPHDASQTSQPAPPQFNPPIASQPYQQGNPYGNNGAPYGQQQQYQQQQQYGGQGYGVPPPQPTGPPADTLAAQMGAMSIGQPGAEGHGTMRRKKKDRHAYHTVDAPLAPSGMQPMQGGGMPPFGSGPTFLDSNPSAPAPLGGQYMQPQITPQMNQFPAPANPAFSPTPASPAEFAARNVSIDPSAAPTFVSAGGQTTVSADDLPSVPVSRDSVQPHYLGNVYPTFDRQVPPPATVSFVAFDQGNASPKFARLTLNTLPASSEGLASTCLPLGLLLQPLAPLQEGELPIPVLDFGESGPPRCRRCRAYINPFMMFRSGGNKFVCNLCTHPNETPSEYFSPTTPQGVRVDRDQRPELTRGTVEFVVPKEYWTKQPVGIRWLFVIDVTQEAVNKGYLEAFCEGILATLYGSDETDEDGEPKSPLPEGAKVGFVSFDRDIHFYNVHPNLEQAQMIIMPDIEDPFVPLSSGLFVDPIESKATIKSLLTRLPSMFSTVKNPEPALLSALTSAVAALEATGGKVICSLSSLPTWGMGRLFMRDDGKHPGGEMDKKLYTTEHPAWKKIAEKMTAAGIGVDFFLAAPSGGYLDVATIGHVACTTGGETFFYPNFITPRDNEKLALEIKHAVTRETGYQALLKVRCSTGLQVAAYHGNFIQHTFGADLEIGVIDAEKAIAVGFSYDGKLDAKLDCHFQSALLYTTASGQRRVRCTNVIAAVTDVVRDCWKSTDQDAVYAMLAKEAATKLATTSSNLKDIRNMLTERTIEILSNYRKNFVSQSHPPGQLVMPEKLKEFCMYMLGLIKSRAFKGGLETSDRRVHELRMVRSMGALELSLYLYPRILAIHNLQPEEGFPDAETGHLKMPPMLRASFSRVEPGGVYLVDNGQQCILWLHAQTSPNLIADLLGADKTTLQSLDPYMSSLPVLETHLNAQVRNIMEFLKTTRGSKATTIQIARQGIDGAEFEFARLLLEDRNNEAQSYVDWLVYIHKAVQLELNGQKRREETDSGALSSFAGLRPAYW